MAEKQEKSKKKWWQRFFKNYREIIIFSTGVGIGMLFSVFLWYIIMLVIGLIGGYSFNKFLSLRKKEPSDKQ